MTVGKLSRIRHHPERFRHARRSVIEGTAPGIEAPVVREEAVVKKEATKRKKVAKG